MVSRLAEEWMSPPRISLCQLSFPDTTFEQDLENALRLDVTGISLAESKLDANHLSDHRRRLSKAGLEVVFGVPATWTILPPRGGTFSAHPSDPQQRIAHIGRSVETFARLGTPSVMVCTGPAGDRSARDAREVVTEGLRRLAGVASRAGTRLSIEPMRESFKPIRTIISTLAETLDLLEEVGDDSIGVVLDLWHSWDAPDLAELLPTILPRVHAVQVADYRQPTRGPMDRVPAGEGVADLPARLDLLREAGYDGWFDLEIFSDDGRFGSAYEDSLWKLDPLELGRRQLAGFLRCWEESENR